MESCEQLSDEELLSELAARLTKRLSADAETEMRELNAKLVATEALKGRFLSNIRNEINNPLTSLRGFSAAIANTPDLPRAQVNKMASFIHREAFELSFQMQNIFAAADLEAGLSTPDFKQVNVNLLVAETIKDFTCVANSRQVHFLVEMDEEMAVMSDHTKLGLILSNLIRNGIEYAHGEVNVKVSVDAETLTIEVWDDGPGIAPHNLKKIFDRFVQLSEGSAKSHPGHGLGLAVARACAELIGGSIEAVPGIGAGAGAHLRVKIPQGAIEHPVMVDEVSQFLFDSVEIL